ncbi:protein TIFY 4B-like isoform X2 [Carica papaya]|uniref:protein TIFY 4B-like isoform X2 n=1 Tax=Carica papaya TaxID=3649 RepID=UPI000B8C9CB9|nr:protein TIFY 4B-like isoform X2 [Carica papaya]
MDAGVTSFRSILDKPLNQLTEEDISQLTREDCRKFLKEKGMRRPSWNKSQAIQQVISLKALLETTDDSGAGALRKILVSPPETTPRVSTYVTSSPVDSVKELGAGAQISPPADENGPYRRKSPQKSAELGCRPVGEADTKTSSPSPGEANALVGQMTIFYCGKVNVYDGVPPDKAQAIMHLAASPLDFPQDDAIGGNTVPRSFPCHLQMSDKHAFVPPSAVISQTMQTEKVLEYPQQHREKGNNTREPDLEGQANRKVLLQRYLEKRKDRGRFFKVKKSTGVTSSGLEMYLSHQVRPNTSTGQSSGSGTNSPPQPGLPHISHSSADNQIKHGSLSVDLNDEGTINLK